MIASVSISSSRYVGVLSLVPSLCPNIRQACRLESEHAAPRNLAVRGFETSRCHVVPHLLSSDGSEAARCSREFSFTSSLRCWPVPASNHHVPSAAGSGCGRCYQLQGRLIGVRLLLVIAGSNCFRGGNNFTVFLPSDSHSAHQRKAIDPPQNERNSRNRERCFKVLPRSILRLQLHRFSV